MKKDQVTNKIYKTPQDQVRLGGYVQDLMMAFFRERIFSDYAQNEVYRECADAFVNCVDETLEP